MCGLTYCTISVPCPAKANNRLTFTGSAKATIYRLNNSRSHHTLTTKITMIKAITSTVLITTIAITMSAQAGLTPKHFGQLKDWAEQNGYFYKGKDANLGFPCYVFGSNQDVYGFVPITSDTADEAINALIASTATFRKATSIIRESHSDGYKEGVADGMERQRNAASESYSNGYREGMADGMERQNTLAKVSPQVATPVAIPAVTDQEPQAALTPIEVTANEIYHAYEDNQIVADDQFKEKDIIVTGVIDDIKRDLVGNPYVTLETGTYWSVQCIFPKEDVVVLTKLSKGQKVRIAGKVTSTDNERPP